MSRGPSRSGRSRPLNAVAALSLMLTNVFSLNVFSSESQSSQGFPADGSRSPGLKIVNRFIICKYDQLSAPFAPDVGSTSIPSRRFRSASTR